MPLPIVAIVGRPNVGKSTLFNRIIRRRAAVVDPQPGVTRDRHYAEAEWNGVRFTLVDTGGYLPAGKGDELTAAVREQTLVAAEEADLVLLVADAQSAPSDIDRELARTINQRGVPAMFVANKVDDTTGVGLAWELPQVGLGDPHPVSARTGYQVADLLDILARRLRELKPVSPAAPCEAELALAIIGAPNSGKSSLVNRLAGSGRMVVSETPGTTRDAVDTIVHHQGRSVRLIDTAGLKRKRFGQRGLEFYCTLRALRALDRCEVAAVLVDGTVGFTQGDIRLVGQAADAGVGVALAVNKWDAVEKDPKSADRWIEEWRWRAPGFGWVPVLFISALTGQRSVKVIEEAFAVKGLRERRISTSRLNDEILPLLIRTPPPAVKGKFVSVKYGSQVKTSPPGFAFFASHAELIGEQYRRFAERLIRDRYGFRGVPIEVAFRKK